MSDFVLSGVFCLQMPCLRAVGRTLPIGSVVATLNRVDPVVIATGTDFEKHDRFKDIDSRDLSAVSTIGSAL